MSLLIAILSTQGGLPAWGAESVADPLRERCEAGEADGCHALGRHLLYTRSAEMDLSGGVAALEKGCELGAQDSCVDRGWVYTSGLMGSIELDKGVALWTTACDAGAPTGCLALGRAIGGGWGDLARDDARGMTLVTTACEGGLIAGCAHLGSLYQRGLGAEADIPKAFELYKKACDGEYGDACASLSLMHETGLGTAPDAEEAARLITRSVELGSNQGLALQIAHRVEQQAELPADIAKALKRGCDGGSGSATSCGTLGWLYIHGVQTRKDPTYGKALVQRACSSLPGSKGYWHSGEMNSALACRWMGELYETGTAVGKKNRREAKRYYKQACELGDPVACQHI